MRLFRIVLAAFLVAVSTPLLAEYPDHTIQIVVPYTPVELSIFSRVCLVPGLPPHGDSLS